MANQYSPRFISDTEKECSCCEDRKPHSEFHKDRKGVRGLAYYCKKCANKKTMDLHNSRKHDADYLRMRRAYGKKVDYGLTLEEYLEKLHGQDSICAVCKLHLPDEGHFTHLDHDHGTGKLREFLCTNCNRGLGHFKDNMNLLQSAIQYLRKHTEACSAPPKAATCP